MDANTQSRLADRLAELCGDAVPGACVALSDGTTIVEAVHGVNSLRTQQPVTPQTMFQIGSITKVYTGSLIMALVDRGDVDLDSPVQRYLPWFSVADAEVSAAVTVRHLLSHTAGFEGDDFTDTGRGDDALRMYVDGLSKAAQIHPLGAMFSYCNSGYAVLGLVIESVTGASWDAAVQDVLAEPLGLTLATLPEQVILQPHALGHLQRPTSDGGTALQVAPIWAPPRSIGPAGTICSSAADLLRFGELHVRGGRAADGSQVLSASSVTEMQQEQVLLDDPYVLGRAWGLSWILPTQDVIGHDGSTFGQYAFYRLHPQSGVAMALLTNGPGARSVSESLFEEFFTPLAGVDLPKAAVPAKTPPAIPDLSRYVGDYERQEVRIEARDVDGGLFLTTEPIGPLADLAGTAKSLQFVAFDGDTLITREPVAGSGLHTTARFMVPDGDQRARWVHMGARATPRRA